MFLAHRQPTLIVMAAAKALLAASGSLKPKTKQPNTSAATEHATSSDEVTLRIDVKVRPLTGLSTSTSEDGALLADDDLEKIVALLLWMAQDFQSSIPTHEIHIAALQVVMNHSDAATGGALGLLHTASIAKLSKLIDIMMLDKHGAPKDANAALNFMRRTAKVREDLLSTASDNATERVELIEDDVSKCYQRFARIMLTHDLLPHQKQNKRYRVQNKAKGGTSITSFQRSWFDNMLRKFLGDKKVAFLIWQHGIPSIADRPVVWRPRVDSKMLDMGMLQSGLDECLQWYICLANDIVVHQTQEGFDAQLSSSSKDAQERQQQQTRREALQKAQDALRHGAALASQRDKGKRSYHDMDEDEQKLLEDYDTGRTKRAKQTKTLTVLKPFRSQH